MADMNSAPITIDDFLLAYSNGLFPMADHKDGPVYYWYDPPLRGQLPIEDLHIPARLRRSVRQAPYMVRINYDFAAVIDNCAAAGPNRPESWINKPIRDGFIALHEAGYAHSVECYDDQNMLAGGLYGLALGGAFMGESMFSRARDASKIALVHLCARLWDNGFTALDTQFINPHLEQFGAYEIARADYLARLRQALLQKPIFTACRYGGETALVKAYLG